MDDDGAIGPVPDDALPVARLCALLAHDGLSAPPGLVDALASARDVATARLWYIAWLRSRRLSGHALSTLRLVDHLGGRADPTLQAARRLGLPVVSLLGVHESLVDCVARALAAAPAAERRSAVERAEAFLADVPPEARRLAQEQLLAAATSAFHELPALAEHLPLLADGRGFTPAWVPTPPARLASVDAALDRTDRLAILFARCALGSACPPADVWLPARVAVEDLPAAAPGDEGRRALARWACAMHSLLALLQRQAHPIPFRRLAARWLSGAPPREEQGWRAEEGLDLAGCTHDMFLVRLLLLHSGTPQETLTWIANAWPEARDAVRAEAVAGGLGSANRTGLVWVHHALFFGRSSRSLEAFKKAVSVAGNVPRSLAELDAAIAVARCPDQSVATWRRRCAASTRTLPVVAWPAARCRRGRDVSWIVACLPGQAPPCSL